MATTETAAPIPSSVPATARACRLGGDDVDRQEPHGASGSHAAGEAQCIAPINGREHGGEECGSNTCGDRQREGRSPDHWLSPVYDCDQRESKDDHEHRFDTGDRLARRQREKRRLERQHRCHDQQSARDQAGRRQRLHPGVRGHRWHSIETCRLNRTDHGRKGVRPSCKTVATGFATSRHGRCIASRPSHAGIGRDRPSARSGASKVTYQW